MQISCVITEDEPLAAEKLEGFIKKIPFLSLVKVFDNAIDTLEYLKNNQVDLLFLDIQMDILDGISFLERTKLKTYVIITTAYSQYALKGYELNVTDYLLKPYSFERFLQAANKVYDIVNNQLVSNINPSNNIKTIFVKTEHRIEKINLCDILYIEGMKDYLRIITLSKKIMTLQNFKTLEDILPANDFARVHKSFIVSINKIESIENNRIKIQDALIPISNTYKDSFYENLKKSGYLFK